MSPRKSCRSARVASSRNAWASLHSRGSCRRCAPSGSAPAAATRRSGAASQGRCGSPWRRTSTGRRFSIRLCDPSDRPRDVTMTSVSAVHQGWVEVRGFEPLTCSVRVSGSLPLCGPAFPGGAGPSGAKLGVLRDGHLHRSQHRLPGSVWHRHRQAKTAVRDGSRRLQRGLPDACRRCIHKGAIHVGAVDFASLALQPTQPGSRPRTAVRCCWSFFSQADRRVAPGRRSVTRCRGPRSMPAVGQPA
jgi:hypothetical protein